MKGWQKVEAEVLIDEHGWVRGVVVPDGKGLDKSSTRVYDTGKDLRVQKAALRRRLLT